MFDTPVTFKCLNGPHGLAAADIDLDGDQDLAIATVLGGTIWIYENKGAGAWANDPTTALDLIGTYGGACGCPWEGCRFRELTFGHFEFPNAPRDAYPDIAVAVDKAHVVWYLRNTIASTGTTAPFAPGGCAGLPDLIDPDGIAARDFDNDGYDDVVVAATEGIGGVLHPRLAAVWNNVGGTFSTAVIGVPGQYTGRGTDLELTPTEIVISDSDSARLHVFNYVSGETITWINQFPSVRSRGISAAPLNSADSIWDIATSGFVPNELRWLRALGGGAYLLSQPPLAFPLPTYAFANGVDSGKLNGDDWIDVVVANEGQNGVFVGNVSVFINNNGSDSPLFTPRYDFWVSPQGPTLPDMGPVQVLLADLNDDGNLDIITSNSRAGSISVLINSL